MEGSSEDGRPRRINSDRLSFSGRVKKESEVNGNVRTKILYKCLFCTEANI